MAMKMESTPYDIGAAAVSDAHSGDARAEEHCSEDEDQSAYQALQHLPPDERRKALRRLRNRQSARRVRARRLAEMSSMEATLKGLQRENEALKEHVSKLQIHTQTVTMKVYEVTAKYEAAVAENVQLRAELQRARRTSLTGDSSFIMPSASTALTVPTILRHNSTSVPAASPFVAPCPADEGSALATPGHMQLRSSSPLELQQQRQAIEEVVLLLQEHKRRRQQAVQDGSGGSDNVSTAAHPGALNTAASANNINTNAPSYGVDTAADNRISSGQGGYSPMAHCPALLYPITGPSGMGVGTGPGVHQAEDIAAPGHPLPQSQLQPPQQQQPLPQNLLQPPQQQQPLLQSQLQPPQQQQQPQLVHALSTGRLSGAVSLGMNCHDASSPPLQPLPPLPPSLPQLPPLTQMQPQQALLMASRVAVAPTASALAAGPGGSSELPLSQHHPQSLPMQSHSHPVPTPHTWQPLSGAHTLYGFAPCQLDSCQQQPGVNAMTTAPPRINTVLSAPGSFLNTVSAMVAAPNGIAMQDICPGPSGDVPGVPHVGLESAVDRAKAQIHNSMRAGLAPGLAGWAAGNMGINNVGGGGSGGLEIPDDMYMVLDDFMPQDL